MLLILDRIYVREVALPQLCEEQSCVRGAPRRSARGEILRHQLRRGMLLGVMMTRGTLSRVQFIGYLDRVLASSRLL